MKIREKVLAGVLTSAITATALVTALWPASPAYAEYTVDFSQGDYSVWDGTSYTFDWYEAPVIEDGVTTYTIAAASDLAGLCVLTNNLSASEFSGITNNISAEDTGYIASVDSFEGKTIKLACDIDLADFDWMSISYPWDTANLTAQYEFTNTEGNIVKYNAVDHIPDDTVDPWVGDENGNPISTRYWEYPESELRFRDYVEGLTFESTHKLVEHEIELPRVYAEGYVGQPIAGLFEPLVSRIDGLGMPTGNDAFVAPDSRHFVFTYGRNDKMNVTSIVPIDYRQDAGRLYTYKDIKNYRQYSGFSGTFDGGSHNIKGLNPSTPWTSDANERLNTYDPIGKGLFSCISESGKVCNLNVKGAYNEEVMSYSGILSAYNFGTIDNCYVDGYVKQSLIEMIYPIAKDYAPNGRSNYLLSSTPGTVMPVGTSGFICAINDGTVSNSYTVGSVEQAFRQFGFIACINNGSIQNCENRASLHTETVETDFITSEWSHSGNVYTCDSEEFSVLVSSASVTPIVFSGDTTVLNPNDTNMRTYINRNVLATLTSNAAVGATTFGSSCNGKVFTVSLEDDKLWLAPQYNVNENESVAANMLYGNYIMTLAGGITAVNNGTVDSCVNKGDISYIENVTVGSTFKLSSTDEPITNDPEAYSYIRCYNQYALFATADASAKIVGGVCGLNTGEIKNSNSVDDFEKERDSLTTEHLTADYQDNLDFIAVTRNGYHQNDVVYDGEIYPFGFRWWVTEDIVNTEAASYPEGITTEIFNRNMPYPFVGNSKGHKAELHGGVAGVNTGVIASCDAGSAGTYPLCEVSVGIMEESAEAAELRDISFDGTASLYICDTNVSNMTGNGVLASEFIVSRNKPVFLTDIVLGGWTKPATENTSSEVLSRLARKVIGATVEDFVSEERAARILQNSKLSSIALPVCADNIIDTEVYSSLIYGEKFAENINNSVVQDCLVYSDMSQKFVENASDTEFTNLTINTTQTTLNTPLTVLGHYNNCTLNNVRVWGDNAAMYCQNSEITDFISQGTITAAFLSELTNENSLHYMAEPYVYRFDNCVCTEMYLESDIEFELKDPVKTGVLQQIPGVLSASFSTNRFDHCVITTPDGALSYNTLNILGAVDDPVVTDAKLVYSDGASRNGALAYYLDKGYKETRTFDYTVAFEDKVNYAELVTDYVFDYVPAEVAANLTEQTLPAHTRKKINREEPSYYALNIPYAGAGAGEIIASLERNGDIWSTTSSNRTFPKTTLFAAPGEVVNFDVQAADGAGLIGMTWTTATSERELITTGTAFEEYKHTSEVMPAEDVTLLGIWSNVWDIEVSDEHADWLVLTPNASAAVYKRMVSFTADVTNTSYALGAVYYSPYTLDGNNNWVLDTETKVYIDLNSACFEMPNCPICLFAESMNNEAELLEIVVAGVRAVPDAKKVVTIPLANSIDITNLTIDSITVSPNAVVTPNIAEIKDFSKPVILTVTSETGIYNTYTVQVIPTVDGSITSFEIAGRMGIIDEDNKTITVTLPSGVDVDGLKATVAWSGIEITPDVTFKQNWSKQPTITVTASDGTKHIYTLIFDYVYYNTPLISITFTNEDVDLEYVINEASKTITVYYEYGTDVSNVQLTKFEYNGSTSNMQLGTRLNLTQTNSLLIMDDIGNKTVYSVLPVEKPNPSKVITQFVLFGYEGTIDEQAGTIIVTLPSKYDITHIMPDAVVYNGESVTGLEEFKDFTQSVEYTVNAFDGTSKTYTVTVVRS